MGSEVDIEALREVWSRIPAQEVRDGGRVDFGPDGNKDRAVYWAAVMGHQFDPKCASCESDLYYVIKNAVK